MHLLRLAVLGLILLSSVTAKADIEDPVTYSPDKSYSVDITGLAVPDSVGNDRFLVLRYRGKVLARQKTIGYLTEVYWSRDRRYVAVNNRSDHFGDYLWVLSLNDGAVVRRPNDRIQPIKNNPFQDYDDRDMFRFYVYAEGWNDGDQLVVKEYCLYKNRSDYPEHTYYCQVNGRKLVVEQEEIAKKIRGTSQSR